MNSVAVPETVAKELMGNISRLETVIEELNNVRKELQENTHQVKCQIHATVSRELEALRNREVWLLGQVDLLQNAKEEMLRGQQAEINKALGSAQKVLQYAQTDRQDLMDEVSADISRLELTDLEPEENSHISFQADSAGLRDTIMEFGRVDGGNRAIQKVFADKYTASASLPKSFEEYDDADHHVLYKTLEEINRGKNANPSINVSIPKLSLRPEDWLIKPQHTSTRAEETKSKKLAFPSLSNNISDWLLSAGGSGEAGKSPSGEGHPPLTRDKSIQDWLLQIKHFPHTHDEEDDFEIVEHVTLSDASDSGMDVLSGSDPTIGRHSINPSHFTQVNKSTLSAWLKGGVTCPPTSNYGDENGQFQRFKHNRSDTAGWLLNKTGCQHQCSQSSGHTEIENLASVLCISDRNMFTHHPDDQNRWLLHHQQSAPRVPPVGEVCKANEACLGYGECVSTPTCCQEYLMSTQSDNIWLINTTPDMDIDNQDQPTFMHIQNMSKNQSDWLANGLSVNCLRNIDKGAFSKWFACMSDQHTDWLKTRESMDTSDDITNEKRPDLDIWLMKSQTSGDCETAASISFSAFEAFQKTLSSAAWLLKCGDNADNLTKSDLDEMETEKKDLTSEKTDLSKWLLNGVHMTDLCSPKTSPVQDVSEWLMNEQVC